MKNNKQNSFIADMAKRVASEINNNSTYMLAHDIIRESKKLNKNKLKTTKTKTN